MKPILIDLDGTILDVRARHYSVYLETLAEFEPTPLTSDEFWRRRREGNSTQALLKEVLSPAERSHFSERWVGRVESEDALALDTPFLGAIEALEELRDGYDLILVTLRRERGNLMRQLDQLEMSGLFRQVISVGDMPVQHKSQLPGMERVARGGYVVGDTEADITFAAQTARNLICVSNGVRSLEFLTERGVTAVIDSIADLPLLLSAGAVTRVA